MVPSGWALLTVGDVFDVQLGKMLNKEAKKKQPQLCYLGNSNVRWGKFELSELNSMYFSEREINKYKLEFNDILVCEGGEVGRCAIWEQHNSQILYQKAIHRLRVKGEIVPIYFQNYMQSIAGTKLLEDYTSRTSIAHLTREKLLSLPIKLPPLPEQQKIAKILSTWDKSISTTERLIENSTQQKKALMQQLLTGKKRLLDESGKRFEGAWEDVTLGKVAEMNSGGTPKSTVSEYYDGDIPWVSIADMTKYGKWISTTAKYLTESGIANSSARLYPEGTVLYAMYASIGECSIAQVPVSSSQAILGIRTKEKLNNLYLYYYLSNMKSKILLMGQQGTQSNLNAGMVKSFQMKLPSLKEQQKIATVLTNADKEIELLEQQLADLQQEKKALMQQLLTGKKRVKLND